MRFMGRMFWFDEFKENAFSAERNVRTAFSVALLSLVSIGIISFFSVSRLNRIQEWSEYTAETIGSLNQLMARVTNAETAQRGYATTGDESFVETFETARSDVGLNLKSLARFIEYNPDQTRRLKILEPLVVSRMEGLAEEIELRRRSGFAAAQAVMATGVGVRRESRIRGIIGAMTLREQGNLQQRRAQARSESLTARAIIVGGSLLSLFVLALALVATEKNFSRRRAYASRLALAGRLGRLGAWATEVPGSRQKWSDEVFKIHEMPVGPPPSVEESINFYAPEYRKRITAAFEACAKNGTSYDLELQIVTARGRRVWVRTMGEAERDKKGQIRRVHGALQDISERKQSMEALQRQQAELRVLFDIIPAMIWFKNTRDVILRVNQRAADAVGRTVEEIEGRPARETYPENAEKFSEDDLEVILTGEPKLGIIEKLNKAGERDLWVQTDKVPVRDRDGKVVGVVVMAQDITERKEAMAALRESEARFRELAENIDEVFWIADTHEIRKHYMSPAFEEIWGRTCQSAYDEPDLWLDSIRPEDRERVRHAVATRLQTGIFNVEYRILRPDGTERWIRDRAFPMRNEAGGIKRWVGVAQDVTDYRAMEEQLRQTQKMEAIGTLAGGIAHDFNNILTSINGYTELSQMCLTGNPNVRDYLGSVMKASKRAADLVRQILTFSRQERVERRLIQLRPVVAETFKLLRASIPSTIEFELSLASDAPTVLADSTQVHQILMNLATNAWHAMKDCDGRLSVRLERFEVDALFAASEPRLNVGTYARISVRDSGCGMDPATLRRIFEPFFTTKPQGEGTGLGLAVVMGIMATHDGAILVHSQVGEGTVFELYFPGRAGVTAETESGLDTMPRGSGQRVLFVDDEELLVQLGKATLTTLGYVAEGTTEPAAALALLRENPGRFALVMTDQTMPGMTGLQLARQVMLLDKAPPLILMTGYSLPLGSDQLESSGVFQLLQKPSSLLALAVAVQAALIPQPTAS